MQLTEAPRHASGDYHTVPALTHHSSSESVKSPITPSFEKREQSFTRPKQPSAGPASPLEPQSAPATTTAFPSKDLPFLAHDPYADDDIIPFDKNKPIIPSRKGSVRSIMSTSSVQSLKRGLSTLKRKLTTRSRRPKKDRMVPDRSQTLNDADDFLPPNRVNTLGGVNTFNGPKRVETFQVCSMAY